MLIDAVTRIDGMTVVRSRTIHQRFGCPAGTATESGALPRFCKVA